MILYTVSGRRLSAAGPIPFATTYLLRYGETAANYLPRYATACKTAALRGGDDTATIPPRLRPGLPRAAYRGIPLAVLVACLCLIPLCKNSAHGGGVAPVALFSPIARAVPTYILTGGG